MDASLLKQLRKNVKGWGGGGGQSQNVGGGGGRGAAAHITLNENLSSGQSSRTVLGIITAIFDTFTKTI